MDVEIDTRADAAYLRFRRSDAGGITTRELAPGVLADIDVAGAIVGIELLHWSQLAEVPSEVRVSISRAVANEDRALADELGTALDRRSKTSR